MACSEVPLIQTSVLTVNAEDLLCSKIMLVQLTSGDIFAYLYYNFSLYALYTLLRCFLLFLKMEFSTKSGLTSTGINFRLAKGIQVWEGGDKYNIK